MTDPLRIYIGCSPAEWLPAKVLEHSIRRNTSRPVEVTRLCDVPIEIPVPKDPKNRAVTLFSFQRFVVPEAAGFQGMALYLDSDMLVFSDIGELFDIADTHTPFSHILKTPGWQSAVMMYSNCRFFPPITTAVKILDEGILSYSQLMNLRLDRWPVADLVDAYGKEWNHTDRYESETKLLHFTNTRTQPWVYRDHPHGELWHKELDRAQVAGLISEQEIRAEIMRGHVRPSLLYGPEADKRFTPPFNLYQKQRQQERKENKS
jgi:hypothetical protein